MRANLHRVAKLEGQPHSSARHSRLSRAMDSLSVDERLLLTETARDASGYFAEPERLDAIAKVLAKVHAFDG